MHSTRHRSSFVAALMLLAVLVSACTGNKPAAPASQPVAGAPAQEPEKKKLIVAVGGGECICYLPTILAQQLGYFKEQGIEAELQDLKGGSKALEALVGGSADVVSGYYEHTIRMQTKQKDLKAFVNFAQYPGLVLAIPKQSEGKIKSVKDLKGKNVGVSAPGSSTHAFINFLLSKEGLKPEDIAAVGIGLGSTAVAAIEKGQVDAAVLLDPAVTQLQNRGSIKILVDTRTAEDTKTVFGNGFAAGGLYASAEFIQKNPVTVQRLANATVKALDFIATHSPEEIAAKMPEAYYAGDKALYIEALKAAKPGFSRDGVMPEGAPKNTLEVLAISDAAVKAYRDKVKLEATFTNEFVVKATKN